VNVKVILIVKTKSLFSVNLQIISLLSNLQGVLIGLFSGISFGIWILIGSLIYPTKEINKVTFIDGCLDLAQNTTTIRTHISESPEEFKIYQIAFLLVPVSGFIISLVLGIIVSLLTGNYKKHSQTKI